jgi:hypothetical protein
MRALAEEQSQDRENREVYLRDHALAAVRVEPISPALNREDEASRSQ